MAEPTQPHSLKPLVDVVERLHEPSPAGCPWCLDQTPATLADELVKEAYEAVDAVASGDSADLAGELGDLLLLVVTEAHLSRAAGGPGLDDVIAAEAAKIIRRHPHVYGDASASTPEDVLRRWETTKRAERPEGTSILEGIPRALPALTRSQEMQDRAGRVGFEWPDAQGVVDKLHEEIDELAAAAPGPDQMEELGDVLFALVNLARRYGFAAETALHHANQKFARRFAAIEEACRARGVRPEELTLDDLDAMWNDAKAAERKSL